MSKVRAGQFGVRIPAGQSNFSLLQLVYIVSVIRPASYSTGTGVVSPWITLPGCDVDLSPLSSVEGTSEWSCTSASLTCLRCVDWQKLLLYFPNPVSHVMYVILISVPSFAFCQFFHRTLGLSKVHRYGFQNSDFTVLWYFNFKH